MLGKKNEITYQNECCCAHTTLTARLCCRGCKEGREVLWGSRQGCWLCSTNAEEWGGRPHAVGDGNFIFLPRLFDLPSLRWYSIGDWRAAGWKKRSHKLLNLKDVFSQRKRWALVPLRKFLWVSKIWTTSSSQACFISGDDASMMKQVTLPSVLRDVRIRQWGSSSECSSTPKQLTWTTEETHEYSNVLWISYAAVFLSPWCCF